MTWGQRTAPVDPAFVSQACAWLRSPSHSVLKFVWLGYEQMCRDQPAIDGRDLERSITQLLEPRIRTAMTGYEPFYIQHGAFEHETMAAQPAQPPQYDLAFVWRADERVMWPLEAKVMATPNTIAPYAADVTGEFLTCRYAPFTSSGAMLGYLLTGTTSAAFEQIAAKMDIQLLATDASAARAECVSQHRRAVPRGKSYPIAFDCYHLMLDFPQLRRTHPSPTDKTLP